MIVRRPRVVHLRFSERGEALLRVTGVRVTGVRVGVDEEVREGLSMATIEHRLVVR